MSLAGSCTALLVCVPLQCPPRVRHAGVPTALCSYQGVSCDPGGAVLQLCAPPPEERDDWRSLAYPPRLSIRPHTIQPGSELPSSVLLANNLDGVIPPTIVRLTSLRVLCVSQQPRRLFRPLSLVAHHHYRRRQLLTGGRAEPWTTTDCAARSRSLSATYWACSTCARVGAALALACRLARCSCPRDPALKLLASQVTMQR